jgi:hypothetical protein
MINRFAQLLVLATFFSPHSAFGQETKPSELDEILLHLEQNLALYDAQIPNLFCHEHVVSQLVYGRQKQLTVTDSTFHLTRVSPPNRSSFLDESREDMVVNGSPTRQKELEAPAVLSGVFSRGLDAVSLNQKTCMRYSLGPMPVHDSPKLQVIAFESIPDRSNQSDCVFPEKVAGRILLDRDAMQVVRMEVTAPHHLIGLGYYGHWTITVNYRPVHLGEHRYWLPQSIVSTFVPLDEEGTMWSFNADYSNYHKFEVTSRIRPFGRSDLP